MKQEDLKNLKIEDLEEVTEVQAFKDGWREMIVWNDEFYPTTPIITSVIAIVNSNGYVRAIGTEKDNKTPFYDHCAEIPQPKMRDMNSLEVMEYLHTFQQWLNGNKKQLLQCRFPCGSNRLYEIEFNNNLSDGGFDGGVVVQQYIDNKGWNSIHFLNYSSRTMEKYEFAILKNGKVTEFKLPQIEA